MQQETSRRDSSRVWLRCLVSWNGAVLICDVYDICRWAGVSRVPGTRLSQERVEHTVQRRDSWFPCFAIGSSAINRNDVS